MESFVCLGQAYFASAKGYFELLAVGIRFLSMSAPVRGRFSIFFRCIHRCVLHQNDTPKTRHSHRCNQLVLRPTLSTTPCVTVVFPSRPPQSPRHIPSQAFKEQHHPETDKGQPFRAREREKEIKHADPVRQRRGFTTTAKSEKKGFFGEQCYAPL